MENRPAESTHPQQTRPHISFQVKWACLGVATKIKVSTVKSLTKEESTMMPDLCLTRKVTDEESGEDRNS